MRPRTTLSVALLTLAAGGAGWLLRGGCLSGDRTGAPHSPSDDSPSTQGGGQLGERITDLTGRIAALEGEVRSFRADEAARWTRRQSETDEVLQRNAADRGAQRGDPGRGAETAVALPDDPAAVEKVRDRWKGVLAESEKRLWQLYPSGQPDSRGDLVAWSRFDDLKKARDALDSARDMAALRALAEGQFKFYFKLDR